IRCERPSAVRAGRDHGCLVLLIAYGDWRCRWAGGSGGPGATAVDQPAVHAAARGGIQTLRGPSSEQTLEIEGDALARNRGETVQERQQARVAGPVHRNC